MVITIVMLIILSTIVINMAFGNNGVVKYAESASDYAANDASSTSDMLNSAVSYIDNITNPETATTVVDAKGGNLYKDTTAITDELNNTVYIPGGFKVAADSATKVEDGIVIEDSEGNQFVWVPVPDYTTMYEEVSGTKLTGVETTTDVYSKLRIRSQDQSNYIAGVPGTSTTREPDLLSSDDVEEQYYQTILGYGSSKEMADAFVSEYKSTYESIKKYKGFYIGRYELTGGIDNPTVQKGQKVLAGQNWYYLKKACSSVVNNEYAQSTMMYGNQWDEIMSWLISTGEKTDEEVNTNSSTWGNYSDYNESNGYIEGEQGYEEAAGTGVLPAGSSEAWKANNIYDLAGNCWEWTQEALTTSGRVSRSGDYSVTGSNKPASDRDSFGYPSLSGNITLSSRVALYVK